MLFNNNMINSVTSGQTQSKYGRRQIIRDSGYTALGAGTLCGITGFKQIKLPCKRKVHKYSAYIAAITSFLHLGAIKRWDKKLALSLNTGERKNTGSKTL